MPMHACSKEILISHVDCSVIIYIPVILHLVLNGHRDGVAPVYLISADLACREFLTYSLQWWVQESVH
jgi:hypothetical protein